MSIVWWKEWSDELRMRHFFALGNFLFVHRPFVLTRRFAPRLDSTRLSQLARLNSSNSKNSPRIKTLPKASYLKNAAISKLFASLLTYPHEVARTRMREQAKNGVFKYSGMWKTIAVVAKEEGSKGLYAGMGTHIARVVPNSAIMFCAYEVVGEIIRKREVDQKMAIK